MSKTWYTWKSEKKWCFRVRGVHIDVTTLERKSYFFSKVANVFSVLQSFGTPKIKKKSVSNRWYMCKFEKKVALSRGRCEHRCHHAAARDLLFERIFRCMQRFARCFCYDRVLAQIGAERCIYIYIWCSVSSPLTVRIRNGLLIIPPALPRHKKCHCLALYMFGSSRRRHAT